MNIDQRLTMKILIVQKEIKKERSVIFMDGKKARIFSINLIKITHKYMLC